MILTKEMLEKFKSCKISKEEVVILKVLTYNLKKIQEKRDIQSIIGFDFNGCKVLDMFKDENNKEAVDPITYYGEITIKNSLLVKTIHNVIEQNSDLYGEFNTNTGTLTFGEEMLDISSMGLIAGQSLGDIQICIDNATGCGANLYSIPSNNKDVDIINPFYDETFRKNVYPYRTYAFFRDSIFEKMIKYYYSRDFMDEISESFIKQSPYSITNRESLYNYLMSYEKEICIDDIQTFYFRSDFIDCETENLRILILEFLQWEDDRFAYTDERNLQEDYPIVDFKTACLFLYELINGELINDSIDDLSEIVEAIRINKKGLNDRFYSIVETLRLKANTSDSSNRIDFKSILNQYV